MKITMIVRDPKLNKIENFVIFKYSVSNLKKLTFYQPLINHISLKVENFQLYAAEYKLKGKYAFKCLLDE